MSDTTPLTAQTALKRLDWECDHFRLQAAQLADSDINDAALAATLRLARKQGVQLLVWPARGGRDVASTLLEEFRGALVDQKATYSRSLSTARGQAPAAPTDYSIASYAGQTPSADLYELAVSAGVYSRFKVDRHVPEERFEAMYRRWIEGSVRGELADAVLVASAVQRGKGAENPLAGMVTLRETNGVGSIGLIAVAADCRGRGIAVGLIDAAHRWMRDRGAGEATVVTQLANAPACRLYERCGYRRSRLQDYYHFWPQVETAD